MRVLPLSFRAPARPSATRRSSRSSSASSGRASTSSSGPRCCATTTGSSRRRPPRSRPSSAQHEDCEHLTPAQVARAEPLFEARPLPLRRRRPDRLLPFAGPRVRARGPRELAARPQFLEETLGLPDVRRERRPTCVSTPCPTGPVRAAEGVIRVMERMGDVELPSRNLRLGLLLLAPIAVAGSAARHAGLLARRALAPVVEVTALAREIESTQLSRQASDPPVPDEIGRLVETFNQMIGQARVVVRGDEAVHRGRLARAAQPAREREEHRRARARAPPRGGRATGPHSRASARRPSVSAGSWRTSSSSRRPTRVASRSRRSRSGSTSSATEVAESFGPRAAETGRPARGHVEPRSSSRATNAG